MDINQSGFLEGRSATDILVPLEAFIREAFARRQHCVLVFFDLQKAYDNTWRYEILRICTIVEYEAACSRCIKNFFKLPDFYGLLGLYTVWCVTSGK